MTLSTSKAAGSTFFAAEYNEITFNINHKQNWAARVFQDGTNTVAVDRQGTVLASVTMASLTDDVPIQAAIDYCNPGYEGSGWGLSSGPVSIAMGNYYPSTSLLLNEYVSVICEDPNNTVFHLIDNAGDFAFVNCHSNWEGGLFAMANTTTEYTKTIFLIDPSTITYPMSGWSYADTYIRDVTVVKDENTTSFAGTAIYLKAHTTTIIGIFGFEVNNVRIAGPFDKGILISVATSADMFYNTIAWNTFDNLWFNGVNNAIYLDEADDNGGIGRNVFTRVFIEPFTDTTISSTNGIVVCGNKNIFNNVFFDDWTSDNGFCVSFTTHATKCRVLNADINTSTQWTYNGTSTVNQLVTFDNFLTIT